MKRLLFQEILRHLHGAPHLKRKLALFIGVGVIGTFALVALMGWAAFAGLGYVTSLAKEAPVMSKVQDLKSEFEQLPALAKLDCWNKAQSLLSVEAWLERPIADSLDRLKVACLEQQEQRCQGSKCDTTNQNPSTLEQGEII